MGDEISTVALGTADRHGYREKLASCLSALERMLEQHGRGDGLRFDAGAPSTGVELEVDLVDTAPGAGLAPAMVNDAVLAALDDPDFQSEIGRWTVELNVPPGSVGAGGLRALEARLDEGLARAGEAAAGVGAQVAMIGLLPTLMPEHLRGEWRTRSLRYQALDAAVLAERGEDLELRIAGVEALSTSFPSIAPEGACCSTQLHLKTSPEDFARTWDAAQLLAGAQVALGANSPFFLGRRLWDESRVEVFGQSVDTRAPELRAQGVHPRAFFGTGWAGSVLDLFAENVRFFPALLPELGPQDPWAELEAGRVPTLSELRLHSSTVWRWNRPVYDVAPVPVPVPAPAPGAGGGGSAGGAGRGRGSAPHLRVENRVLPAGPSPLDTVANAALFYGVVRVLVEDGVPGTGGAPVAEVADFARAREDFSACARTGLDAVVAWPGRGEVGARELVLEVLLPMAADGLARWGAAPEDVERYLGVARQRAVTGLTGAVWQTRAVEGFERRGADRVGALQQMLGAYTEGTASGEPVHAWPLPG